MSYGKCSRCGRCTDDMEKHHIHLKSEGGGNRKTNLMVLCRACHDYQHTRYNILLRLSCPKCSYGRSTLWQHRLRILDKLNTPEKIRESGSYISYWSDPSTHY